MAQTGRGSGTILAARPTGKSPPAASRRLGLYSRVGARICSAESKDGDERGNMMANPLQFIQQVRTEVGKVSWPTRREVLLTTAMVFVMATLTSLFFFTVDLIIRTGLTQVLRMLG
ncbi:protein translocase subunit secE/sec61 gamma [Tropicimonas isoalkanivorans]|uniref:Protein translocase subunit SecE n=2 Tax=Tropicimonas isoalkanivorans TaxID=441112 RepID=A0A1I1QTK5_9RHOB|nr:protein translocase subunit secE/sec61 gamma [Tropicimonas isoalkanivorans]